MVNEGRAPMAGPLSPPAPPQHAHVGAPVRRPNAQTTPPSQKRAREGPLTPPSPSLVASLATSSAPSLTRSASHHQPISQNYGEEEEEEDISCESEAPSSSRVVRPRKEVQRSKQPAVRVVPAPGLTQTGSVPAAPAAGKADGEAKPQPGVKKKRKRRRKARIIINTNYCKYEVVRECASQHGWEEDTRDPEGENCTFTVFWTDTSVALQRVTKLKPYQRINHFPSMHLICRKVPLAHTLGRMKKASPQQFRFFPSSWSIPAELNIFRKHLNGLSKKKTYIIKPSSGCQGKGISLTRNPLGQVEALEDFVVQDYVSKPYLIDGLKFDMRVYALVLSVCHLRVFVLNDGLVRLCTVPYQKPTEGNLSNVYMHLTNYAINKTSENYVFNEAEEGGQTGSKRDFNFLREYFRSKGVDPKEPFKRIDDLIIKTLISAQPQLSHVYNACFPQRNDGFNCFEILGFDVMFDSKLRPYLLEVNHSPSWNTDTPLDRRIKTNCIRETMALLLVRPEDRIRERERQRLEFNMRLEGNKGEDKDRGRAQFAEEAIARLAERTKLEDQQLKNFSRIFPTGDPDMDAHYHSFLEHSIDNAASTAVTAASKEREREAQQERERREKDREEKKNREQAIKGGPPKQQLSKQQQVQKRERDQARLLEQMERHKRRMQLGPRLSVFQLCDARYQMNGQDGEVPFDYEQMAMPESMSGNPPGEQQQRQPPLPNVPQTHGAISYGGGAGVPVSHYGYQAPPQTAGPPPSGLMSAGSGGHSGGGPSTTAHLSGRRSGREDAPQHAAHPRTDNVGQPIAGLVPGRGSTSITPPQNRPLIVPPATVGPPPSGIRRGHL